MVQSKIKIGEIYINTITKKKEYITAYLNAQLRDYRKIKRKSPIINKRLTKDFIQWQRKEMTWKMQTEYSKIHEEYKRKHNIKNIQTLIINNKRYIMGNTINDIHNRKHHIDYSLQRNLEKFKRETNKNPIRNNKLTGTYLYWYQKTYYPKCRKIEDLNILYRNKLLKHIAIEDMEFEGISNDKLDKIVQDLYTQRRPLKPSDVPINIIKRNQRVLKNKFGNSIVLYKGIGSGMYDTTITMKKRIDIIIFGNTKNCISWTDNLDTAFSWGSMGYVIKVRMPIRNILLSYYGSYYLRETGEYEFICISYKLPTNSYIIFKTNARNNNELKKIKIRCRKAKI